MADEPKEEPDVTAVRVALWRALHVAVDPPPHVLTDRVGLKLLAPGRGWRARPDMDPSMGRLRATIVARARFIEDLAVDQVRRGVSQFVILGAGLDSFAQRRPNIAAQLRIFEVDRPGPQAWKRRRLVELGLGIPSWLTLVPVDFEQDGDWWGELLRAGFDPSRPAVVASAGVSMYLTREANVATLRQIGTLASGSTLAMTFHVPAGFVDPPERPFRRSLERPGSPFISAFAPAEMTALAREAGFRTCRHVSAADLGKAYFAGRADGLQPSSIEDVLLART
jgi:methyltransferase (TIGR00027 family)